MSPIGNTEQNPQRNRSIPLVPLLKHTMADDAATVTKDLSGRNDIGVKNRSCSAEFVGLPAIRGKKLAPIECSGSCQPVTGPSIRRLTKHCATTHNIVA